MLPDYLTLNARWHHDKPAMTCAGESLSWAELDVETNRVANALLAMGLKHGERVGLVMSNSLEMAVIMLAVGKAGGVVAPINLTVPDEALLAMLADASAAAVFVSASQCARLEGKLPGALARNAVVVGDDLPGWIGYRDMVSAASSDNPGVTIRPEDWIHVVYSSGTTGLPKGIVHTHGNRIGWTYDLATQFRFHQEAQILLSIGLFSNFSWAILQMAVMLGASVVIEPAFSPRGFLEAVQTMRITHCVMVPVQYQMILQDPEQATYDLSSLQSLVCGGSPLHEDLLKAILARFDCAFFELYGTTEGTMTAISRTEKERFPASVGRPFQGSDIKVIDAEGHELGDGEPGELVTFSPFLMEGYLNRPDANREAEWHAPDGRVWLRTGDVGKRDENGMLTILDRIKDMIVSGAQNIFPADIETVLNAHADVAFGTVIGVAHPKWGETPLAVVTLAESAAGDTGAIVEWVNQRLGKRQRIAGLVIDADIPRNPNGKVLKRLLRDRYADFIKGAADGA